MAIAEYIKAVRAFRVARGRVKYMRDTAGALYRALQRDFSGSRIKLTGRAFDEANPDESVDEVSLDVWPSGEELADAISQFRQADAALAAAWQSLSEEEQEAVVDPREE